MARWRALWAEPTFRARAYLTGVISAGLFALVGAAVTKVDGITVQQSALHIAPSVMWLLVALVVLGEARPVLSRRGTDGASLGLAFAIAIYAVDCWQDAVFAQALAMLMAEVGRRHGWTRLSFNVAQQSVSYALGGLLFYALTDRNGALATLPNVLGPARVIALVSTAIVVVVVNHVLVWMCVTAVRGVPFGLQLHRDGWRQTRASAAMVCLAPLVVGATVYHAWLLLCLLPAIYVVHGSSTERWEREWESMHDLLTGLPNSRQLRAEGDRALEEAARTRGHVAVLLLDLDRFKDVNDTLGHLTGDQLLRVVASRLSACVGSQGTLARWSGDEFVVLLPRVRSGQDALAAAHRIAECFTIPFQLEAYTLDLECSIGVAEYPGDAEDFEELLQRADVAMYQAKRSRSGIARYEAERDQNTPDRLALLGDLRRALAGGEIQLHYQPKVSFAAGQVVGFEGLVRWNHATRGPVNPEEFVQLAEQTGLMSTLTTYVVERALAQAAVWWRSGLSVPIAVNVSMRDIHAPNFVTSIQEGLAKHGVPAEALQLEITERVLLQDPQRAKATLERLDALGVNLSLDDFGTGYSSLVLLRSVPVREIKIDKSFVARLAHDAEDAAIVRSTVDLAHSLGLKVVAEGVEDEITWQRLAELGCDVAQGWLLAKALPAHEATAWLNRRALSVPPGRPAALPAPKPRPQVRSTRP
ncbi:MAG TPA: EAL domain-containing protein [Actinospica sp.]|jgi:diguanylate cyclase (GGDEF)-like protein|nr:EAL domain-containing protein [Actinospica sp.]